MEWNRAHFGAWCIVSAPLVLGLELTEAKLTPIIDIITNREAIAVNQDWAGHPGTLVWQKPVPAAPPPPPSPSAPMYVEAVACESSPSAAQAGWSTDGKTVKHNGQCLDGSDASQLTTAPCGGSNQAFVFNAATQEIELSGSGKHCVDVWDFNGPRVDLYACNKGSNQAFAFASNGQLRAPKSGGGKCLQTTPTKPGGGGSGSELLQLWAKPQSKGGMAVLLINSAATTNVSATIDFASLNITGSFAVRDVWNRKDLGTMSTSVPADVPASDSAFFVLTPA